MFAGRIYKYDSIEVRCSSSASGSGASNLGTETIAFHSAKVSSPYTPDHETVLTGLRLSGWAWWSLTGETGPTAHFEFAFGDLSDSRDFTDELQSFTSTLRLVNPALYVNANGVWELHVGSIEWEVNGDLQGSYDGGVYYGEIAISPLSMPLFTGVLVCEGNCTLETGVYSGAVAPGNDSHGELTATATMGYRVLMGGTPYSFPAQLLPLSMPTPVTGVVETDLDGIATVSDCYTVVVQSEAAMGDIVVNLGAIASNGWDVWRRVTSETMRQGTVTLVGDPGFSVSRLNSDYSELVYRGSMPGADAHGRYVYQFAHPHPGDDPGDYSTSVSLDTVVYDPASEFLDVVANDASPLEDVFRTNWSWPSLFASVGQASAYYIVPPGTTSVGEDYTNPPGVTVTDPDPKPYGVAEAIFSFPSVASAPGAVVGNLAHASAEMTLLNTVCNPLWSTFLYFPNDGLDSESANAWKADGNVEDPSFYWLPRREQLAWNSLLPEEKNTKDRLQVVAECLSTNGLAGLMSLLTGGPVTSYWGISRFEVLPVNLPESVTCSVHESWSVVSPESVTLGFDGTGVTVSGSCRLRLELFRFSEGQGLFNGASDGATLAWDDLPDGAALRAFWVSFDGTRSEMDLSPGSGHFYAKPQAISRHYMDSAVEDWEMDGVPDAGTDLKSTGNSASAYADAAFGLINEAFQPFGTNRQYLRLEFEFAGLEESFRLHYPVLGRAGGERRLIYDRPQRGVVLQSNAGPIRWGTFCYFDLLTGLIVDWPLGQEHALAPSALDAFGFAHNLAGSACTTGLAAEVSARFDEGIEYTQLKHLAVDPFTQAQVTHSLMLLGADRRMVLALANSYREVPPLAAFPHPARDPDSWSASPDLGFEGRVVSWGQVRRWCAEPILSADPASSVIQTSDGTDVPSEEETSVDGWRVWSYRLAEPSNDEVGFRLLYRDVPYVRFRPWRGLLWTLGVPPSPSFAAGYDVSSSLRHVRSFVPSDSENFWLGTADNRVTWEDSDSGLAATWARPRFADLGEEIVWVLYGDGSNVWLAWTRDLGETWSAPVDLGEGKMGDFEEGASGLKWLYKLLSSDGGDTLNVWGQLRDNRMNVVRDWTLTNLIGVDDAPISVRESIAPDQSWRIGLLYFSGGDPVTKFSKDGLTFF